ncbi:hypothetical protein [Brachybacterium sp. GPGPB12]|uniref:hypothetical protein n=1 Tax=Brachybacterium sp. GPGPB12 TaxID=3023517 RepID=UPI003134562D
MPPSQICWTRRRWCAITSRIAVPRRRSIQCSRVGSPVGAAALVARAGPVAVAGLERALVPVAGLAVSLVLLVIADEATSAPRRERARPRRGA